jgi:hypothetical protein
MRVFGLVVLVLIGGIFGVGLESEYRFISKPTIIEKEVPIIVEKEVESIVYRDKIVYKTQIIENTCPKQVCPKYECTLTKVK